MHIYLCVDESGTFNSVYEQYYILSAILVKDIDKLQKLHYDIEPLIRKRRITKEMKASSLRDDKKALFVNALLDNNYDVFTLAIDKKKLFRYYNYNISEFFAYNFFLKELLEYIDSLNHFKDIDELIILVDSRSMDRRIYLELESYLNLVFYKKFRFLKVIYKDSATNREIQMVDYIANTFYGKLNNSNLTYRYVNDIEKIHLKIYPKID